MSNTTAPCPVCAVVGPRGVYCVTPGCLLSSVGRLDPLSQDEYPDYDFADPTPSGPPSCKACKVELCDYLDAYYSADQWGKERCDKCRRGTGAGVSI